MRIMNESTVSEEYVIDNSLQLAQIMINNENIMDVYIGVSQERTVYIMYSDNIYECVAGTIGQVLDSILNECIITNIQSVGTPFMGSSDELKDMSWAHVKDTHNAIQFEITTV